MTRPIRFGHIGPGLAQCAARIYSETAAGTLLVWVDDKGVVLGTMEPLPDEIPVHWLVGSFSVATSPEFIVDDLRALMRERAKDWILS